MNFMSEKVVLELKDELVQTWKFYTKKVKNRQNFRIRVVVLKSANYKKNENDVCQIIVRNLF